jgi:hypothetical protein
MQDLRNSPDLLKEPVFTSEELAELKRVHLTTIIKWFMDEPGVMRIGKGALGEKRQYFSLRIPASVAQRVFQRMTVSAGSQK